MRFYAFRGIAAAVVLVLIGVSCQDLVQVEYGFCGNGVLERQAGEDCEPDYPDEFHTCIAVNEPNECRFSCGLSAVGVRLKCPPGWGCGADDVCREPSGTFAAPFSVNVPPLQWLEVGDFNGDRHDDVVWSRDGLTQLYFFDDGKPYDAVQFARRSLTRPVIEDLNKDGLADLLLPTLEGLLVYRGQTDDTLLPTPFLSYQADVALLLDNEPLDSVVGVSANIVPEVVWAGPTGVITRGAGAELILLINGRFSELLSDAAYAPTDVLDGSVAHVLAGEFDETGDPSLYPEGAGTPDEVVVVFAETPPATSARVIRPRVVGEQQGLVLMDLDAPGFAPVTINVNEAISGILGKLQLNPPSKADPLLSELRCAGGTFAQADDHLDLVFSTEAGLRVAFGRGDGTFHSDACSIAGPGAPDNAAGTLDLFDGCTAEVLSVLAVAQLDADGLPDLVRGDGVVFSRLLPQPSPPALSASLCAVELPHVPTLDQGGWLEATVVDVNGDGVRDVAATTNIGGLDLITIDSGGEAAYQNYSAVGRPSQFSVHDLDGDGVDDLAFVDDRQDGPDQLFVLFGEPLATPAAPVALGAVEGVMLLAGRRVDGFDGVDDLVIIARDDEGAEAGGTVVRFGAMLGRPDRELQAAFQLNFPAIGGFQSLLPLFVAAGNFTGNPEPEPGAVAPHDSLAMVGANLGFTTGIPLAFGVAATQGEGGDLSMTMITPTSSAPPFTPDLATLQGVVLKLAGADKDNMAVVSSQGNKGTPSSFDVSAFTGELEPLGNESYQVVYSSSEIVVESARLLGFAPYDDQKESDETEEAAQLRGGFIADWAPHVSPASIVCDIGGEGGESVIIAVQNTAVDIDNCTGSFTQLLRLRYDGTALSHDPTKDVLFDAGAGAVITGYACINNDLDLEKEIAVLVLDYGALDCDFSGTQAVARLVVLDTQGGVIGEEEIVAEFRPNGDDMITNGVLGFNVPGLAEPPLASRPPMSGVGAGDFNGDGIDDLLIGAGGTSLVLLGQTVNP